MTFSYPLTNLNSSFLGFKKSEMVEFERDELIGIFDKVKAFKKQFHVVNPTRSLEEMQRFLRDEPQQYPCLGGYRYFYLDWKLQLWRCHFWEEPLCSIYDFDETKLVRDGCTRCMIDCYRDASTMQHIAVSAHDAIKSLRSGDLSRRRARYHAHGKRRIYPLRDRGTALADALLTARLMPRGGRLSTFPRSCRSCRP